MKYKDSLITQITLANGAALVAGVAGQILKDSADVVDTFNDTSLNEQMIHQLAQTSFQNKLTHDIKG